MIPVKDELLRLNLPRGGYALFGGALLSVYNIRKAKDLDIIVKQGLWDILMEKLTVHLKANPTRIHIGNIEIFKDWMILTDRIDQMIDTAMIIENIPFVRVEYVLEWKRWMGRPKDKKDIQRIEEFERLRMQKGYSKFQEDRMKIFTIGYGGRTREGLIELLRSNGVSTVVDVRLRPDRASMGIWVKAKLPDKGIEKLLTDAGIGYRSLIELGNLFLDYPDWQEKYKHLLEQSGDLLFSRLTGIPEPFCLLCAEKKAVECHRLIIADYLAKTRVCDVQHLE